MHRYTSVHGLPALLDADRRARARRRPALPLERDNVLVAAGATGGLGAVAGAILEPGDEVLILAPYWPLIDGIVRSFHGTPVAVPVARRGGLDAAAERGRAASSAVAPRAPSRSTSRRPTTRAAACCRAPGSRRSSTGRARHDLWIIADEVYEHFVYRRRARYARCRSRPSAPSSPSPSPRPTAWPATAAATSSGRPRSMGELRKVATHTFYATPTAAQLAAVRGARRAGRRLGERARARQYADDRRGAPRRGSASGRPRAAPSSSSTSPRSRSTSAVCRRFLERCVERGLLLAPGPSFGPYPTHVRALLHRRRAASARCAGWRSWRSSSAAESGFLRGAEPPRRGASVRAQLRRKESAMLFLFARRDRGRRVSSLARQPRDRHRRPDEGAAGDVRPRKFLTGVGAVVVLVALAQLVRVVPGGSRRRRRPLRRGAAGAAPIRPAPGQSAGARRCDVDQDAGAEGGRWRSRRRRGSPCSSRSRRSSTSIPSKAPEVYRTVGANYVEVLLEPQFRSVARGVTASYDAKALYTSEREHLARLLAEELREAASSRAASRGGDAAAQASACPPACRRRSRRSSRPSRRASACSSC